MGNMKKYTRSTNFTQKEESLLLQLVKKYRHLIELKKLDTNTNHIKMNAWIKLTKEYNDVCPEFHRDLKTLRNKYGNLKKRRRLEFNDPKQWDGPEKDIDTTTHNDRGMHLTGFKSEFDDDASEILRFPVSDPSMELGVDNTDTVYNNINRTSERCSIDYRLDEWTASKIEHTEIQKQCQLEEHDLKMKHLKEQHEQQLRLREKEAEERREYLKREHQARMELLEIEKKFLSKKL